LKEVPYSQEEADAAAGLQKADSKVKKAKAGAAMDVEINTQSA
jgi:hypothetical protein